MLRETRSVRQALRRRKGMPSGRLVAEVARAAVSRVLERSGVALGGTRPWDVRVSDDRFYARVLAGGALALGESYVDGQWECDAIDELVARLLSSAADDRVFDWHKALLVARARVANLQTRRRAGEVAEAHYDLGNDFFERMLGPTMNYSCAYWREARDLDSAQRAKMDLIAAKLGVATGHRVLDIGCGWGALLAHLARTRGCEGVGVTVSRPQAEYARAHAGGARLDFRVADYRSEELARLGPFDRIVSVGMFEHVGQKNHRAFMQVVRRLLAPDGLVLLQTIGNDHSPTDPWLNRYIFPNGSLPSTSDLARAIEGLFVLEDWHNFRADYDRTVLAWHANFERDTTELAPSPRFRRMWRYYLLAMAGCFRAGSRNQLWQLVLSRAGVRGGYRSLR